jgi:hypothetical protein
MGKFRSVFASLRRRHTGQHHERPRSVIRTPFSVNISFTENFTLRNRPSFAAKSLLFQLRAGDGERLVAASGGSSLPWLTDANDSLEVRDDSRIVFVRQATTKRLLDRGIIHGRERRDGSHANLALRIFRQP